MNCNGKSYCVVSLFHLFRLTAALAVILLGQSATLSSDAPALNGAWRAKELTFKTSSKAQAVSLKNAVPCNIIFTDKALTLRMGKEIIGEMTYTTDPVKSPATIDVQSKDGPMVGIYRWKIGILELCLNDESKGRPENFEKTNNGMSLELERYPSQLLYVVNADGSDMHNIAIPTEYTAVGSPDWSRDGRQIAIDAWRSLFGEKYTESVILVMDASGGGLKDLGSGAMPSWSPDGKQIAYSEYSPNQGIAIMDADGANRKTIEGGGWAAQWSPKENLIACTCHEFGFGNIRIHNLENQSSQTLLEKTYQQIYWGFTWSPDGRWICFKGQRPDGGTEIAAVSVEGERNGFKLLVPGSEYVDSSTTMAWGGSGNEILVAMKKNDSDAQRLYVVDFTGSRPPNLFPNIPADWESQDPAWSPDGNKVAVSICLPMNGK